MKSVKIDKRRFKKGQKLHLDTIYDIQGVGDTMPGVGKWWEHKFEDSDDIVVTKNIDIEIRIKCSDENCLTLHQKPR